MNYTYSSTTPGVVIANCEKFVNIQLEYGKDLRRTTRLQYDYPIVDLECKTSCSKQVLSISGTLKAVGLNRINSGSHIQLAPESSLMGYTSK